MQLRHKPLLAGAALAAALRFSACGRVSEAPDPGNVDGGGGVSGTGGGTSTVEIGCTAACCPTDESCYVSGQKGPGAECLAVQNNDGKKRFQLRSTWFRSTTPPGLAVPNIHAILQSRTELPIAECNMPDGNGGFIWLMDFDLSNDDPTKHTVRSGFASPVTDIDRTLADGLCFADFTYDDQRYALDAASLMGTGANPLPWTVKPNTHKRFAEDFTYEEALQLNLPEGEGLFYLDDASGEYHMFAPIVYVALFDSPTAVIVPPIRGADMRGKFNDARHNCIGAYNGDGPIVPEANCQSSDPLAPPWGCLGNECVDGEAPHETLGYFLIVDMEQIWSDTLQSTLCVSMPGQSKMLAEGWADNTAWGMNCQGAMGAKGKTWDPQSPITGLPDGDWCSTTNQAATADCHDAYLSKSFATFQAFPITAAPCDLGTLPR